MENIVTFSRLLIRSIVLVAVIAGAGVTSAGQRFICHKATVEIIDYDDDGNVTGVTPEEQEVCYAINEPEPSPPPQPPKDPPGDGVPDPGTPEENPELKNCRSTCRTGKEYALQEIENDERKCFNDVVSAAIEHCVTGNPRLNVALDASGNMYTRVTEAQVCCAGELTAAQSFRMENLNPTVPGGCSVIQTLDIEEAQPDDYVCLKPTTGDHVVIAASSILAPGSGIIARALRTCNKLGDLNCYGGFLHDPDDCVDSIIGNSPATTVSIGAILDGLKEALRIQGTASAEWDATQGTITQCYSSIPPRRKRAQEEYDRCISECNEAYGIR